MGRRLPGLGLSFQGDPCLKTGQNQEFRHPVIRQMAQVKRQAYQVETIDEIDHGHSDGVAAPVGAMERHIEVSLAVRSQVEFQTGRLGIFSLVDPDP